VTRLQRFNQQSAEYYKQIMDTRPDANHHSEDQVQQVWDSVDYWALSMPTRPSSPSGTKFPDDTTHELKISPDAIFDFGDFTMLDTFGDSLGDLSTFPATDFNFHSMDDDGHQYVNHVEAGSV
jgi:hypothetical protein